MEMWHTLYKETRRNIELSGKGARWEFNQPLLFTRTDYIGTVARDLGDVVQVIRFNVVLMAIHSFVDYAYMYHHLAIFTFIDSL
jgi:hypothetical protein